MKHTKSLTKTGMPIGTPEYMHLNSGLEKQAQPVINIRWCDLVEMITARNPT